MTHSADPIYFEEMFKHVQQIGNTGRSPLCDVQEFSITSNLEDPTTGEGGDSDQRERWHGEWLDVGT
jgi:hypothetical protein